jgi:hypothetical protein
MKLNKKKIAAILAGIASVVAILTQLLSSLPDDAAPAPAPAVVASDAGVQ